MTPRITVCVTDTLPPEAREVLSGFEILEPTVDADSLARVQALLCWPSRVTRELVGAMKELQMIQAMSAGVDTLDFAIFPKGVRVFSNAGAYTGPVAEHAWGLLLGGAKGLHVRGKRTTPREFRGKTLLVLGGGAIGSEVARLAKSLSMRTVGVSRSFRVPEIFDEKRTMDGLRGVIGDADAVVLALPLTNLTRGLVDYELLSMAKDSVTIVNVGRGNVVVEEDLIRWLKERPESRYVTDVFWTDNGKESFQSAAWDLPNFAGTLHRSWDSVGNDLAGPMVAAARNVKMFLETGEALNPIDPSEYVGAGRKPQSG